ncbi:MAG TPA: galactosyltransferase-related protein [Solirubrobacteraceae bacterium]|nr:galactosyltransferase-related protein [Solirubrobacteraceae bacterium]
MRCAVITLAHGRHEHLLLQQEALATADPPPDRYVVVAIGDEQIADVLARREPAAEVIGLRASRRRLPLARARNAGAELALRHGAELLVFLDADCVAHPQLIARYAAAATLSGPALLCGPVGYLPPARGGGYRLERLAAQATPHPARPVPREGELLPAADLLLFWSLSFAITAEGWRRVGGFCEEYEGYGGEDTDFAQLAAQAGLGMMWVGGAWAYHQHHESEDPPLQHAEDIVQNANLFHRRWGWWPMEGWLAQFAARGVARFERASAQWQLLDG